MQKDIKKLKEEQEKKVITNVDIEFEKDEFDPEIYEYLDIQDQNYDTYIMCEKNKKETGWFYPDDDEEEI